MKPRRELAFRELVLEELRVEVVGKISSAVIPDGLEPRYLGCYEFGSRWPMGGIPRAWCLRKTGKWITIVNVKKKLTPQEWMDDILEYERTHEIAFASPSALAEARVIAKLEELRRSKRRANSGAASRRRRAVSVR